MIYNDEHKQLTRDYYEILLTLNGRRFSTLDPDEKCIVELFCYRTKVTPKGSANKLGQYTALKPSYHAKELIKWAYLGSPPKPASHITILEDVEMKPDDIGDRSMTGVTNHIYADALVSLKNNCYKHVHRHKLRVGIIYPTTKDGVDAEKVAKSQFLGTEVAYRNPLKEIASLIEVDISRILAAYLSVCQFPDLNPTPLEATVLIYSVTEKNGSVFFGNPEDGILNKHKQLLEKLDELKIKFNFPTLEIYKRCWKVFSALTPKDVDEKLSISAAAALADSGYRDSSRTEIESVER